MPKNNRSEYRTWPMILEQVRGGRPVKTAEEAWVIQACKSLPTRTKNSLTKLGIQFSGDLQYVTAAELKRQGGISVGAVEGLQSICEAWGITLGGKAADPVPFAADIAQRLPQPEAVNHPAHYTPGPFEVYKVLDHFQVFHPKLWNAVKYLSRAHAKGREAEDRAKAAWYLENFLCTNAGHSQIGSCTPSMDRKAIGDIAANEWGCSGPTVAIIELVMEPYTTWEPKGDGTGLVREIGYYMPQIFQAWRLLTAEVGK